MEQVLVLNATWAPLKVVSWQRAVTLFYQKKVEIVETYEDREVRSVSFTFKMPSVVRLLRFVRARGVKHDYVPFTRANIYRRDGFTCQYCATEFEPEGLTFDHVIPVAQGGRRDWTNIVTACFTCNTQKGARTPQEAGLTLLKPPKKPSSTPVLRLTLGLRRTPATWRDYLYWNAALEDS